jgi:hypothetical protein
VQHLAQLTALQDLDITTERHPLQLAPRSLQPLAALKHLARLKLGNNLACHDTFELAAALPQLSALEFSYLCADAAAGPAQQLAPLKHSRSLRRLLLSGVRCSDELLELLAQTAIEDLELDVACMITATAKGAARMAGRLRRLQLHVCDANVAAVIAMLPVLGLSQLTQLSLSVHKAAADYGPLLRAVFGLQALQDLHLSSHYHGLSEAELEGLPGLMQLTRLSLSNHFTDATLASLLRSTPNLRQLRLSCCGDVGEQGLRGVLGLCGGLRSVELELMRGATAAGVCALAAGAHVGRLVLEGCRNVSADECRQVMAALNRPELDIIRLR